MINEENLVKQLMQHSCIIVTNKAINENIINQLKNSPADIMYVYSEKSAINLKNLIKKYSLVDDLINCNLMCISEKSSRVLSSLKWKKIFVFNPGEEEFLLYKI